MSFLTRESNHYAATGENASICFRGPRARLQFRKGRADMREAVQLEVETISDPDKRGRTRSQYASVAFSPEQWAAIVKHVEENRTFERGHYKERHKQDLAWEREADELNRGVR